MDYVIQNREPKDALRYFEELSAIPRGSRNEKAAAEYLMAFAKEHGLWCHMDEMYNVYIKKPGTPGCENLPPVLMQGHTDIVCEKNQDTVHDFEKDGLKLYVEGNMLKAKGTTLGADNAVAVTYMMSFLARNDFPHPPLECIFTVQEEIGLNGAYIIDPELIQARRMLNIDSGPEGVLVVGAAGGQKNKIVKPVSREPVQGIVLGLHIRGLFGGHSGRMIDKERGNANKLMARLLHYARKVCDLRLVEITGGDKDNAIPRECDAVIALPPEQKEAVVKVLREQEALIQNELAFSDAGFVLNLEEGAKAPYGMIAKDCGRQLIEMMFLAPCGVVAKSMALKDLTVCSLNMGVVRTSEEQVVITYSVRSSEDSLLELTGERLKALAAVFDASVEQDTPYPSWRYKPDSPLRHFCEKVYKEHTGEDLKVEAVHGGLECGVFLSKVPDMDIVALGVNNYNAHTPQETMDLDSYGRVYTYIEALLRKMAEGE